MQQKRLQLRSVSVSVLSSPHRAMNSQGLYKNTKMSQQKQKKQPYQAGRITMAVSDPLRKIRFKRIFCNNSVSINNFM